jgi:phage baseplate assembly protein W
MNEIVNRSLAGYRWVETQHGDTLQKLALRYFGDATRWAEIAHLNDLVPPFIADDSELAGPGVLLSGSVIMIPAAVPSATLETDADRVFGRDCVLEGGALMAENGDFKLISGVKNLSQAIKHRVATTPGELMFHGDYGCEIRRLLGRVSGPTSVLLAAQYVASAVEEDPRVSQVTRTESRAVGDTIVVEADVQPISGNPVTVEAEI